MKTRTHIHSLYKEKSYNKFIDLISGSEEVTDGEINLLYEDYPSSVSCEIETNGLRKNRITEKSSNSEIETNGLRKKRKKSSDSRIIVEIIDKKIENGNIYYRVKWKGKGRENNDSTWELSTIFKNNSLKLLRNFENRRRKRFKLNSKINTGLNLIRNETEENLQKPKAKKKINRQSKNLNTQLIRISSNEETSSIPDADDASYKNSSDKISFSASSFSNVSPYTNTISNISSEDKNETKKKFNADADTVITNKNKNDKYLDSNLADIKNDKIRKIISAQIINKSEVELICLLEFEQRPNGYIPDPRKYSSKLVRYYAPQCLIDFLISRIVVNPKPI